MVGKTRRGVGVGDQWVKAGDWNLEDHLTELFLIHIRMGEGLLKFAENDVFYRLLQWWVIY